jgi:MATE family multidrug resistance protein
MTDLTLKTHEKTEMPDHWRGELSALLTLGIPMALTQLAGFAIYTIDVLMIGRLSPEDLAAASLGTVIYFLFYMIGIGPVMAVTPLASQALGADKNEVYDVRISVRMALWTIGIMTPLVLWVVSFAEPIAIAFGQDPDLSKKAGAYVFVLAFGWPFAMAIMALRNFLASIGKTRIPLVLAIVTTIINALLNYVLIFGMYGFPKLGLVGAGVASSIATDIGFGFFIAYIYIDQDSKRFHILHNFWKPHWYRLREIVSLGWPISITTVFEGMLFNACVFLMGILGVMQVAAYQIALNVAALAFMLPWGLSMAGGVRIGLARGAQNQPAVKRAALTTVFAAVVGIMLFAIPIALAPEFVAGLYMELEATQVAANQLLRGLKDVRWAMVLAGISFWAIGFPVAYYLGLKTEAGAVGIWYGLLASLFAASVLLGARLWYLVWRKI